MVRGLSGNRQECCLTTEETSAFPCAAAFPVGSASPVGAGRKSQMRPNSRSAPRDSKTRDSFYEN